MTKAQIVLTVYANGIKVHSPLVTLAFYRDWVEYFQDLNDWRPDVSVCVRFSDAIYLPR
jgi:hypothetical protein